MKNNRVEILVGLFVLAGLICVGYLTLKLGKLEIIGGDYYSVNARFTDVTGLNTGAYVEMAGVRIGRVNSIRLDPKDNCAIVNLKLAPEVALSDDTIASIKTSGLIGDKYVKLSPGGSGSRLAPGGMLTETESSVDLTDLIGKYVFGGVK